MANLSGTNLVSPVVPFTTEDKYPTHMAEYGKGGWRSVKTKADLDLIPAQRMEAGMGVYVLDEKKIFIYTGKCWEELKFGADSIDSIPGLADALAGKQATISDLDSIRSGAAAGATALQTHQDISGKQDKTDSSLPTAAKTIVGAIKELWEKLKDFLHGIKHVTWEELKELRDNGELVAGQWYRITDYVTTIANDPEARSAGHPFDLLVMATSNDTLSEEARAVRSSRSELVPAKFYSGSWGTWFVRDSSSDGYFDGDDYYAWRNENDELAYTLTLHPEDSADVYVVYDEDGNNFCHIEQADYMESFDEYGESVDEFQTEHEYFAHSNLNAWKVWYCIDNDTTRFAWADPDDGTGVIYRMIDEWQNDCPYDFKNVQFKRYRVVDDRADEEYTYFDGMYVGFGGMEMNHVFLDDEEDYVFLYTFGTSNKEDLSVKVVEDSLLSYAKRTFGGNTIKRASSVWTMDDEEYLSVQTLNNIVLCCESNVKNVCSNNEIGGECFNMTFISATANRIGYDSQAIIAGVNFNGNDIAVGASVLLFGDSCTENTFGNGCNWNSFGNYCNHNTFGNGCYWNSFGNDCRYNTFGNNCWSNTFGNDCNNNTFGNGCYSNTFGNYFQVNSFGNDCGGNSFGNYCYYNTFGNNFAWNSFGNYCYNNTFGNSCGGNSFGNGCSDNSFGNDCYWNSFGNYLRYITVFDGVQYVSIPGGSSDSDCVKNLQILNGTHGSDQSNRLTIAIASGQDYCQIAGLNSDGELRIWAPADLV